MNQLAENEKSRWRIALMMLQHSERFRLLKVRTDEIDSDRLLEAMSDLLDELEERIPYLCGASKRDGDGDSSDFPVGAAPSRKRKQRFSFSRT